MVERQIRTCLRHITDEHDQGTFDNPLSSPTIESACLVHALQPLCYNKLYSKTVAGRDAALGYTQTAAQHIRPLK